MTVQQAATNITANVPCRGIGRSADISIYNSRAVDPNRPRYNRPSCVCAERITPEFPASIVYNTINIDMPNINIYVEPTLPDRIGFSNVATPSVSPIERP